MPLVIFQLKIRIEKKTRHNIPKRMATEQTIPLAETGTGSKNTIENKNHGNGNLENNKEKTSHFQHSPENTKHLGVFTLFVFCEEFFSISEPL